MEKYISGEEHKQMVSTSSNAGHHHRPSSPMLVTIVAVVVALAVGFGLGIAYQKGNQPKSTSASTSGRAGGGFGGGRFGGANRVIGTVSAISSSSISVDDQRSGSTVTLTITSSTQITDNGQTVNASDIQTGDTVFVTEDSSNTSNAARILVNPSFGGFGGQSQSSSSSSSVSD